jgi:hypothetical protein
MQTQSSMQHHAHSPTDLTFIDIIKERTGWLAFFCVGLVIAAGVVEGATARIAAEQGAVHGPLAWHSGQAAAQLWLKNASLPLLCRV